MSQLILRNPNSDPLSHEQLRKFSPAIFAKGPHESTSNRYGFISTDKVLIAMHDAGFVPVEVRNYQRRDPTAFNFTKHMIRFRKTGKLAALKVNDVVPEIVLLNSHDRSSLYQLFGGLFRLVCTNGLLVAESAQVQPVKLRHTINVVEHVVEQSIAISKHYQQIFQHVDVMRKHMLDSKRQLAFARGALALRAEGAGMIEPASLLVARRKEDEGNSLWNVFNRVQENLTKGGLEGKTKAGRVVRTAQINSINADIRLNVGVWALAMEAIAKASASSKKATRNRVIEHA